MRARKRCVLAGNQSHDLRDRRSAGGSAAILDRERFGIALARAVRMRARPIHAFPVGAVVLAVVVGLLVWLRPSRRVSEETRLAVAERLPEAARAALRTQMHTHARGMLELTSTATLLDYGGVRTTVARLLDEPRVARPLGRDATELNAQLPARFFTLQDQLRDELHTIDRDAAAHDPEGLAHSFGAAIQTCIHCHDAYLGGR